MKNVHAVLIFFFLCVPALRAATWTVIVKDLEGNVVKTVTSPLILDPIEDRVHLAHVWLNDEVVKLLDPGLKISGVHNPQYGASFSHIVCSYETMHFVSELKPFPQIKTGAHNLRITKFEIRGVGEDVMRADVAEDYRNSCSAEVDHSNEFFDYESFMGFFTACSAFLNHTHPKTAPTVWSQALAAKQRRQKEEIKKK